MVLPQRSICLSIRDSKVESVATKISYRATLNPFLSYSARYRNNRFFFSYKSLNFEGYQNVSTLIFMDQVVLMYVNTDHDVKEWD